MNAQHSHSSLPYRRILGFERELIVPPAGPGWFGAVMGTGILANLMITVGDLRLPAAVLLVIGWVALIGLTFGFLHRSRRDLQVFLTSLTDVGQCTGWGMVSMGYLAVGSATPVVFKAWNASPAVVAAAWHVDFVMWLIGAMIGIAGAFGFAVVIVSKRLSEPRPVWGLPLVAPMVASTTGAAQIPQFSSTAAGVWMLMITTACFFLALVLASVVFFLAYMHAWRRSPLPTVALPSMWIPLGIVGQSTAAAHVIAASAAEVAQPHAREHIATIATTYGCVMMLIGLPMIIAAFVVSYRGLASTMPFQPGWWALTFPVGTLSLGTHYLGERLGFFTAVSVFFLALLTVHWLIAAYGTSRSVLAARSEKAHQA